VASLGVIMASLKEKLKAGMVGPEPNEESEPAINELVEKVFTTRNLVHFAHWNTNSYASHMALGELYEDIVEDTDHIVEVYQGEFSTLLQGLETGCAKLDGDIIARIKADAEWVKANRLRIANGSTTVQNLVDGLTATYYQTIYKLQNLH
jgi:hypothetical protein